MQKYRLLVRVDWEEPTGESRDTKQARKGKREVVMGHSVPKVHHKNGQRGRAPLMKEQLPFDLGKPAVSWCSHEAAREEATSTGLEGRERRTLVWDC